MKFWRKNGLEVAMSPLHLTPLDEWEGRRRKYKLEEPFSFTVSSGNSRFGFLEMTVCVPRGFVTDLGTIPLLAQLFIGGRDDYAEIYVLHDFLCERHVPQFICNMLLRAGMFCVSAPRWKRLAVFYAVMVFGYQSTFQKVCRWVKRSIRKATA